MSLRTTLPWAAFILAGYLSVACHAVQASPPLMVDIPAGEFWMGSTPEEREYGYGLDETLHGSTVARVGRAGSRSKPGSASTCLRIASTATW